MKRKIIPIIFILFLFGCASTQLPLLNLGINVSEKYMDLRSEYEQIHETSSPEMQAYMEKTIAPKLNQARERILDYNDAVLRGTNPGEYRELVVKLLVEISRMMEVL